MMDEVSQPCAATAESCTCMLELGHEGPHECECDGRWLGDIDGDDFEAVELPRRILATDEYVGNRLWRP